MNKTYMDVLSLIKSALTNEKAEISETVDWEQILRISKRHQIIPLIYYGIQNSNLHCPQVQSFAQGTMRAVLVEQNQFNMFSAICKRFLAAKVDWLPLKGLLLKHLYPKTEMRVMSDMDILIREEQLGLVRDILEQLGCEKTKDSDHVTVYQNPPFIYLEIHTRLVPSYDSDYYEYFRNAWSRAKCQMSQPYGYEMATEDMFLFEIVHLAKHYREGGIGLRHFIDIWVMLTRYPDLNMKYIRSELRVLKIERFFDNILATLQYWFENSAPTEITEFLTLRTFESGSYGTLKKHKTAVAARISEKHGSAKKGRLVELFSAFFMPLGEMKKRYSILQRCAGLLPIMWIVRWVSAVFGESERVRNRIERVQRINEAELNEFTSELEYVGLQFNLRD